MPNSEWRGNIPAESLDDFEQLDLEDENSTGRHDTSHAPVAIGDARRADKLGFLSHFHPLQPLGPALDDLVHGEFRGLAPLVGAVELGPVDEGALIVHLHGTGELGALSGAG